MLRLLLCLLALRLSGTVGRVRLWLCHTSGSRGLNRTRRWGRSTWTAKGSARSGHNGRGLLTEVGMNWQGYWCVLV
jgi:hypothetical protein